MNISKTISCGWNSACYCDMPTRRQRSMKMHIFIAAGTRSWGKGTELSSSISPFCLVILLTLLILFLKSSFCSSRLVRRPVFVFQLFAEGDSLICIETPWDPILVARLKFKQLKVLVRRPRPWSFLQSDNFYWSNQACWASIFAQSLGLLLVFCKLASGRKDFHDLWQAMGMVRPQWQIVHLAGTAS